MYILIHFVVRGVPYTHNTLYTTLFITFLYISQHTKFFKLLWLTRYIMSFSVYNSCQQQQIQTKRLECIHDDK